MYNLNLSEAQICNPSGNLIIFSNYDGGQLNINIDVNIPNLKIGIVSYESAEIQITGAFASNVTEVIYAGIQGTNNNCGPNIPATSITGVPVSNYSILTAPPVTSNNINGYDFGIICGYSCDVNTWQGGCNTIDQIVNYFTANLGGTLYALSVQYNCWVNSTTYTVSGLSGVCCSLPPSPPDANFTLSNDTICVGDCINLFDASSNSPTAWNWTMPGANISGSSSQNPSNVCYNSPGNFDINLTASNADGNDSFSQNIVVVTSPTATISYPGNPFNGALSVPQSVTQTGTGGGIYTSSPTGLSMNPNTGAIIPSLSVPGNYVITYTIAAVGSCVGFTANTNVTINAPSGGFNCDSNGNVIIFTNYDGGELNIDIDQNIPNLKIGICSYEPVKVTISGLFSGNVTQVLYAGFNSTQNNNNCNIGNFPTSIIGVPLANQTILTIPPVTVSNPNGYNFGIICAYSCDANTNQGGCNTIDQIEDYFMTQLGGTLYSLNAQYCCWLNSNTYHVAQLSGACCLSSTPAATINYVGSPFCNSISQIQNVNLITNSSGSFSASPAGLSIDALTGAVLPSNSLAGIYTITYTMPGCPNTTATTQIEISNSPNATIAYAGPYANSITAPQNVVQTGSTGGTFTSSPNGLNIDALTGEIIPSLSIPNTYIVTYTIAASPPCQGFSTTATVVITANSNICDINGNVMIFSNYEGGILNVIVDQNIPNLKIGICTYEATEVNFSGPFVGNISQVIYAGFNGINNTNCGNNISSTNISGVPSNIVSIFSSTTNNIAATTYLGEPAGAGLAPLVNCMTGAEGCTNGNAGGGNSSPQIVQYFLSEFGAGSSLFAHFTQYNCFNGNYSLSAGGNCCLQTPVTPPNPIYAGGSNYNFILPEDTLLCGSSITIDLSFYQVLYQPPTYPGYVWSDGTTGPIINITQPGTYSFTVGDYCHYGSNLLTDTIIVLPCCLQPPAPVVTSTINYCLGDNILPLSAIAQNGGTLTWYGDASLSNALASGNNYLPTLSNGINNFYVTETEAGCEGPASLITVTLNIVQTATFSYAASQFCQSGGNAIPNVTGTPGGTFTSVPNGVVFVGSSGEIDVLSSVVGNYSIIYTSPGPCAVSDTFQLSIIPSLNGGFYYDNFIYCKSNLNPVAILDTGANYGVFSVNPNTLVFSNISNGTIDLSLTPAGIYTVTNSIAASGGCAAYIGSFTITIVDVPNATISYENEQYCAGANQITLPIISGDLGGIFTVSPNNILIDEISGAVNLQNAFSGIYNITYTIPPANGCSQFQTSSSIQILPAAELTISSSVTINQFQTATLYAQGNGNLLWDMGATTDSIFVKPSESMEYCVTNNLNGCTDTACTRVYVEIECGDVFIPSAFSPNNDNNNDLECVLGNCIETMYIAIFDRWGEKLFESNSQIECWDGTYKGKACNAGVYVYRVELTLTSKEFISKQGNITLIR
ncbi:MAG TPA: gliding motility-associated C-terminal domain-containing protein [Bacteroidia bacterium]|nr:gliding motility-associated C-terminal domain-containing protein [Bacteroidia bacterium]